MAPMENSLFGTGRADELVPPPGERAPESANNEAVLQALLMQGVGREIRQDASEGKRAVLERLVPKTRGLKRLVRGIEDGGDRVLIRGADDAVDVLDVVLGIVGSKFVIQEPATAAPPMETG